MKIKKLIYCMSFILVFSLLAATLSAKEDDKINLNSATVEDLVKIPGIDKELAERIIETREENGEFVDMDELLDIEGVDAKLLRKLKKHIKVEELDGCNC